MPPSDFFTFLGLYAESEESIRARIDADANATVEFGSDQYTDTRQGSMFQVNTHPSVLEFGRVWDALGYDVPAASHITMAWGEYLDYFAADLGEERHDETKATGNVLFTGSEGALVPSGIRLTTTQTDPDIDPPVFVTTESGVIAATIATPTGFAVAGSTASGSLPSGTYYYKITAVNEYGETLATAEQSANIAGTGRMDLTWTAVAGASGYKIYRSTSSGAEKYLAQVGMVVAYTDTGSGSPTTDNPPSSNTTGGKFRADVEAYLAGAAGDVGVGAINTILDDQPNITSVTNEGLISGGTDVEDDEALRARLIPLFEGGGAGNIADYRRWALEDASVAFVTVVPVASGPDTVEVVLRDANNDPVSQQVIDRVQLRLDPLSGQGAGEAPVSHNVTVTTPALIVANIVAAITFKAGYDLDGASGNIALRDRILVTLAEYINGLDVGDDIVYDHVKAQFYAVPGVFKVTSLTVNAGTADIAISAAPPQLSALGSVTLS